MEKENMKRLSTGVLAAGLIALCASCAAQKGQESIAFVAQRTFESDRDAGIPKIYYPAYSPMNIKAANAALNSKGIFVVGYGDVVESQLLYEFQEEYNKHVNAWLKETRQTDIDTLLEKFKRK
jgi:hypothetical protein